MSNTTAPAARIALVRSVGAGIRKTDIARNEIVASLPEGFDYKARGAVAALVHAWACGDATPPAIKTGPKGNQTTTDYGRGHDSIVTAVKRALSTPPAKVESITVTYIDADGKSHTAKVEKDGSGLWSNLASLTLGTNGE